MYLRDLPAIRNKSVKRTHSYRFCFLFTTNVAITRWGNYSYSSNPTPQPLNIVKRITPYRRDWLCSAILREKTFPRIVAATFKYPLIRLPPSVKRAKEAPWKKRKKKKIK